MKKLILTGITCLSFFLGCTNSGAKFEGFSEPPTGSSVLYVYRPSAYANGAMTPHVYINDQRKGILKNGGYQVYILPPGTYRVKTDGNFFNWPSGKAETEVSLLESETKYVRLGSKINPIDAVVFGVVLDKVTPPDSTLRVVHHALAAKELPSTSLSM